MKPSQCIPPGILGSVSFNDKGPHSKGIIWQEDIPLVPVLHRNLPIEHGLTCTHPQGLENSRGRGRELCWHSSSSYHHHLLVVVSSSSRNLGDRLVSSRTLLLFQFPLSRLQWPIISSTVLSAPFEWGLVLQTSQLPSTFTAWRKMWWLLCHHSPRVPLCSPHHS